MVQSLEIMKSTFVDSPYLLMLRDYDGVEVSRTRIMRMSAAQAAAIIGPHTGISLRSNTEAGELKALGINPQPIEVVKVRDRLPGCRAWRARIAGKDATYLSDEAVHCLQSLVVDGGLSFERGQPDWSLREIERIDDLLAEKNEQISLLRERRDALLSAWRDKNVVGAAVLDEGMAP